MECVCCHASVGLETRPIYRCFGHLMGLGVVLCVSLVLGFQ